VLRLATARQTRPLGDRAANWTPRRHGQPWTEAEDARLRRDYPELGPRATALALGRSREAVFSRVAFLRARHPERAPARLTSGLYERIDRWPYATATARALWELGWAAPAITHATGLSEWLVYARAREYGWARPATLSPRQVGAILGRTPSTVHFWQRKGWIVFAHAGPTSNADGITEAELLAWLAEPAHVCLWRLEDVAPTWYARLTAVRPGWIGLGELAERARCPRLRNRLAQQIRLGNEAGLRTVAGAYAVTRADGERLLRVYAGRAS